MKDWIRALSLTWVLNLLSYLCAYNLYSTEQKLLFHGIDSENPGT